MGPSVLQQEWPRSLQPLYLQVRRNSTVGFLGLNWDRHGGLLRPRILHGRGYPSAAPQYIRVRGDHPWPFFIYHSTSALRSTGTAGSGQLRAGSSPSEIDRIHPLRPVP